MSIYINHKQMHLKKYRNINKLSEYMMMLFKLSQNLFICKREVKIYK